VGRIARCPKLEARHRKPKTRNSKPDTQDPRSEPETGNAKPETDKLPPGSGGSRPARRDDSAGSPGANTAVGRRTSRRTPATAARPGNRFIAELEYAGRDSGGQEG
jgi:hypothetical protein